MVRRQHALTALGLIAAMAAAPARGAVVIVDNTSRGFSVLSQSWGTSSATGQWGDNYRYKDTDDSPAGQVEWRPVIPWAGQYEVAVWYYSTGSGRPNNAHYTVHHAGGTSEVYVNQQINGSQWVVLGTYGFAAGTAGSVTLTSSAQAGKNVVADAVRFRDTDANPPEFRAFWADAFNTGFKSTSQIDNMIARALEGNYNAIVAEVLAYKDQTGGGHGAYWNPASPVLVPKAADISGGIDPLAYLCQQAHAQGIEVHAWLVAYRVSTSWPPSGNGILAAHPEWFMVELADMGGGPATIGSGTDEKYYLDPGSPEVQDYLMAIVRELVTNYEIDGINWDYIRYTQADAGYPADASYTKSSLARFQEITGYVGAPPTNNASWSGFRRRTVDELVRRCRAEMASIKTNPRQPLRLSADLLCSGDAPSDFSSSGAYGCFQNFKHWMEMCWLDAAMPMNYKREYNTSQAQWYRNWVDAVISYDNGRHVYCGQANYLNTKEDSITQMRYALDAGALGTVNYSYYSTADENMDGTLENDWTWYPYVSASLFVQPTETPPMHWRDAATATEGTLWGQVIDWITGNPVDDATVQVDSLSSVQTDGNGYYVVTLVPATVEGISCSITATKTGLPSGGHPAVLAVAGDVQRYDLALSSTPAVIGLDPVSIELSAQVGSDLPSETITVTADGGILHFTVADNADWLSVEPGRGSVRDEPAELTVSYNTAGLAIGDYSATITISDPAAGNSPQAVAVHLEVTPMPIAVDYDGDYDVDLDDFAHLQACLSGPNVAQDDADCQNTLLDNDSDVDSNDLSLFLGCLSGAGVIGNPDCLGN